MTTRRPGEYADADQLAQELAEQEAAALAKEQAETPEARKDPTKSSEVGKETPKTALTWEDRIKEAGLTVNQATEILDALLERGYYEKEFRLYGGRRQLVLRSRDHYCRQRLTQALDQLITNDPRVHLQTQMRMLLAGSLVQFGKKTLVHAAVDADIDAKNTAFNDRLKFIDTIGEPFLDVLYESLSKFDAWVYAALSNGAPSNF